MFNDDAHRAAARRWVECAAAGRPPEQALQNFEAAFRVVWKRANRTLSDVTLMAILDRVLHDAAEQYPLLTPLKVERDGLRCTALRSQTATLDQARMLSALEFVIARFLSVLGSLAAEILTPALHAELAKAAARNSVKRVSYSRSRRPASGFAPPRRASAGISMPRSSAVSSRSSSSRKRTSWSRVTS